MLPRTDPLEMNSRIQHPVFAPTPGGGVRYLLDRRFDRPKPSLGEVTKKPFPSQESNTDRPSHSLINVLIKAFQLLLTHYTISGPVLQ